MDTIEVKRLKIQRLKNLHNFEISLAPHRITSIMGPNCSGKTTLLNALASCFQPVTVGKNSLGQNIKFSHFLVPSSIERWTGNTFEMEYENKTSSPGAPLFQTYAKNSDRWSPKYQRRPFRPVFLVNIRSCVPRIETERKNTLITFTEATHTHSKKAKIIAGLSQVMGRDYGDLLSFKATSREYLGLESSGLKYADLTMGAGEQRVYKILDAVWSAPKGSLILVDELDLLLHKDSLDRLINYLIKVAEDQELQVVFTSHNQEILAFEGRINIRHIFSIGPQTICLNETTHEAILRLTGSIPDSHKYEFYVEDEFSKAIVSSLALDMGIRKSIRILKFGSAVNGITTAAGIILKDRSLEKKYFVLDGDVIITSEEKESQIKKVLTGDVPEMITLRNSVLPRVIQYSSRSNEPPEKVVTDLILSQGGQDEISNVLRSTGYEVDKHQYTRKLCAALDMEFSTLADHLIRLAHGSAGWDAYVSPVKQVLEGIHKEIGQI